MSVLKIAIVLAMAATVAVLLMGLVSMARGGRFDERYANLFMRLRVALQGVAILLILAAVLLAALGYLDG